MTDKNNSLSEQLAAFLADYQQKYQQQYQHLPIIEHDQQWPSPCIQGAHSVSGYDYWQPERCNETLDFSNVENALALTLHPDIKCFFTQYYADVIDAKHQHGQLQLLFVWSLEDFTRLQENIIGHVLTKRRLKQPVTVFFAVTDQEDFILSIDNETGAVLVEQIGKEPHIKLAESLAQFIEQLTPVIP